MVRVLLKFCILDFFMKLNKKFNLVLTIFIIFLSFEAFVPPGSSKINLNEKVKNLKDKDTIWIFNGKDLSNLKLVLENKDFDIGNLYSIKNKILYVNKQLKGYFRTKDKYTNFSLHAEWKWTKKGEKGNSGILFYVQPPDTVWPNCIQVNLKANHAGDLIAMSGASFKEAAEKPKNTALIFSEASEKPEGEWNSCDVLCMNDSMSVYINGILQNRASGISNPSGTIGLQLEGKPIAFKNIYLIKN